MAIDADTNAAVRQCVEELRQLNVVHGDTAQAATKPPAKGVWVTAFVLTALVAASETMVLLLTSRVAGPPPPSQVLAMEASDLCAQRQEEIMVAIEKYTRARGEPPRQLSELGPPYLLHPGLDPISGRPYRYSREGSSVSLECPNPERHAVGAGGQQELPVAPEPAMTMPRPERHERG